MTYYHGTDKYFKEFRLPLENSYKDFGVGVYLAVSEVHARQTALWKKDIHAYIYVYDINITDVKRNFNVREFRGASLEWVQYIVKNRTEYYGFDYDLIIGPTADAHVQREIERIYVHYETLT